MRRIASSHEKGERLTTTKLGMQRYKVFKRSVRDHKVSTQHDWKAALSSCAYLSLSKGFQILLLQSKKIWMSGYQVSSVNVPDKWCNLSTTMKATVQVKTLCRVFQGLVPTCACAFGLARGCRQTNKEPPKSLLKGINGVYLKTAQSNPVIAIANMGWHCWNRDSRKIFGRQLELGAKDCWKRRVNTISPVVVNEVVNKLNQIGLPESSKDA